MREANWEKKYYEIADKDTENEMKTDNKMRYVLYYCAQNSNVGDKFLEIGCGTASLANFLRKKFFYTGLDISEYALNKANKRLGNMSNVNIVRGTADKLPFKNNEFKIVFSRFGLEHFDCPRKSLAEMVRVLQPSGSLIIITPNLEFPFCFPSALRHKSIFFRIGFYSLRLTDYFLRLLGIFTFRTIADNYLKATGKYEIIDDDLVYIASTFEILRYLEKHHKLQRLYVNQSLDTAKINFIKNVLKQFIAFMPGMKYYGDVCFIIMRK